MRFGKTITHLGSFATIRESSCTIQVRAQFGQFLPAHTSKRYNTLFYKGIYVEMTSEAGYINYFETLGIADGANPGEARKVYKRLMKKLLQEIAQAEITPDKRNAFILDVARLNGACYVLKDKERREAYLEERGALIKMEAEWCALDPKDTQGHEKIRGIFDSRVRSFLSKYVEEMTLTAGQDREILEASNWNEAHARYATSLLRYYRQHLYNDILERLPFHEVTEPKIDWDERESTVSELLGGLC